MSKAGTNKSGSGSLEKALTYCAEKAYNTALKREVLPEVFTDGIGDILEEIVEATHEFEPHYIDKEHNKPEGYLVELADVVIATLTLMQMHIRRTHGKTVGGIIVEKMKYNMTRED